MKIIRTGLTHNGGYVHETVVHALQKSGYRLLDTARRYGTEKFLPYAIQDAGLHRDQVYHTFSLKKDIVVHSRGRGLGRSIVIVYIILGARAFCLRI